MTTVKVSRKLQVAVPAEARHALGIEAGDWLEVSVGDGELRLRPLPRDPLAALRERHGALWRGGSDWLEEERQAWTEPGGRAGKKSSRSGSRKRSRRTN